MLPLWDDAQERDETKAPRRTRPRARGRADGTRGDAAPSAIVTTDDLPGPIAMRHLTSGGELVALSPTQAYRRAHGASLYGRARIVADLAPRPVPACGVTAAWVWLGGAFPDTIELLTNGHFRTLVAGRRIRARSRRVPPTQLTSVGPLTLTTPTRTACDLALYPYQEIYARGLQHVMLDLMRRYGVSVRQCMRVLDGCSYLHTARQAREVLADFTCIA